MIIRLIRPTHQYIFLLISLSAFWAFLPVTKSAQAGQTAPVSLTLPIATLHQTLNSLLPLPVEPQKKNFQGTFVVDAVSRLTVKRNNVIALQGHISGRNMAVNARVGGRTIQIKLGQIALPISCDITLRYDRKSKTLFLKPTFSKQDPKKNPTAAALGPLLDGLSKEEYTLPLDTLKPLTGEIGDTPVSIQLEPVDIGLSKDSLILRFLPHAGKK